MDKCSRCYGCNAQESKWFKPKPDCKAFIDAYKQEENKAPKVYEQIKLSKQG